MDPGPFINKETIIKFYKYAKKFNTAAQTVFIQNIGHYFQHYYIQQNFLFSAKFVHF